MSIELKKAAQQAIDAFEAFGEADDFATLFTLTQKMNALRTAIQQAETKTTEPVAVILGLRARIKAANPGDAFFTLNVLDELANTLLGIPHPAPGVPDGYVLVPIEPTEEMLLAYTGGAFTEAGFSWCRHQWAAMLTAAQAQHGSTKD